MRSVLVEIPPLPSLLAYALMGVVLILFVVRLVTAWRSAETRKEFPSVVLLSALMAAAFIGLLIYWRGHPILVRSYGFMLMLGFAAGTFVTLREARRCGVDAEVFLDFAIWALVSSIVAARLTFVMLNAADYEDDFGKVFQLWGGGLSFHGGLAGGIIALIVFCRRRKLPFLRIGDLIAPALPLGYAFARVGCFLNGCCYGTPTKVAWAVAFPDEKFAGAHTPPSHPTQIYALLLSLVVFGVLWGVRTRTKFAGQLICLYLILYSIERFIVEFFRKDVTAAPFLRTPLTQGQVASIVLIVLCVWFWRVLARRAEREKARVEQEPPQRKKKREKASAKR
ncbi:MAG: prolipoprotein diacylglyceryl transferase [Abditibacteriales bacterium]|nr:prolipoprotein diacylglyceryl transferase [Abditibacteriales bacterium]MDW8365345.1 prolipoprotein diacylglyceryl transferase [Abditibacteriales bacterium]